MKTYRIKIKPDYRCAASVGRALIHLAYQTLSRCSCRDVPGADLTLVDALVSRSNVLYDETPLVHRSVCLSVCLSMSVCLCVFLSQCLCPSICECLYLWDTGQWCLSVCLSMCLVWWGSTRSYAGCSRRRLACPARMDRVQSSADEPHRTASTSPRRCSYTNQWKHICIAQPNST